MNAVSYTHLDVYKRQISFNIDLTKSGSTECGKSLSSNFCFNPLIWFLADCTGNWFGQPYQHYPSIRILPYHRCNPVSYTHLDVYKRQPHGSQRWMVSTGPAHVLSVLKVSASKRKNWWISSINWRLPISIPVSYTHLDVYKRQILY